MMAGNGAGAKEIAEAINRTTSAVKENSTVKFVNVDRLVEAVHHLQQSLDALRRSPLAALASGGQKDAAATLVKAFDDLSRQMKEKQ